MDNAVLAALAKWPDVPHCYGWLSLDRRGQWRLQGEVVRHRGLADFIGRNYTHDDAGNWFFQNGPQRVYVELEVAPWVLHLDGSGNLTTHTGCIANRISAAWLDEHGHLILLSEHGPGVLDDRDAPCFLNFLHDSHGNSANENDLLALMEGENRPVVLHWTGHQITVAPNSIAQIEIQLGYVRAPGESAKLPQND